jgi:ankyrin repeat protein
MNGKFMTYYFCAVKRFSLLRPLLPFNIPTSLPHLALKTQLIVKKYHSISFSKLKRNLSIPVLVVLESSSSSTQAVAVDIDEDATLSKFFAAAKNNIEAEVEDLVESVEFQSLKESINFTDAFGNSPLLICAQRNWADAIVMLLANDHCNVNHQNLFGSSALMCSSSHGHIAALKVILESKKLDIDQLSRYGQTALIKAAQAGKLESIKILIAKGANIAIINKQGKGVLEIALEKEHNKIVEFLRHQT